MQAEEKQQLQHKQGGGGREQVVNLQDGINVTGQPNASWCEEADDNSLRKRIMVRMYELLSMNSQRMANIRSNGNESCHLNLDTCILASLRQEKCTE